MDRVRFARYTGESARIIFAPIYIGMARGYFHDADIEVEDVEPGNQPWEQVAAWEVDCGAGMVDYCVKREFAGHMKAAFVQETFRKGRGLTCLMARRELIEEGSLTEDYATLRGRTIGLAGGRADDYLPFLGCLRQGGLTIDDVKVAGGNAAQRAEGGELIDLVRSRRPRDVEAAMERGMVIWKSGDETYLDLQARYILFTLPFMEQHPDVVTRFIGAYLRGARDYCDAYDKNIRKDAMLELLVKETGETREMLTNMKPLGLSPNGTVDFDQLAKEMRDMFDRNLLPPGTTVADMVDHRFVEAALNQIGSYK